MKTLEANKNIIILKKYLQYLDKMKFSQTLENFESLRRALEVLSLRPIKYLMKKTFYANKKKGFLITFTNKKG